MINKLKPIKLYDGETFEDVAKSICKNKGVEDKGNYPTYFEYLLDNFNYVYHEVSNLLYKIIK